MILQIIGAVAITFLVIYLVLRDVCGTDTSGTALNDRDTDAVEHGPNQEARCE